MAKRVVHVTIDRDFASTADGFDVIDPLWGSVNIYDGPAEYEATLARFTKSQRLALAAFWYQAEVDNGGHGQFFTNSTGIVWKDALAALETIGLDDYAEILREAVARLGGDPPLEKKSREALYERLSPTFEDLDRRFYALEEKRDLGDLVTEWIHARPDDFVFDGPVEKW